MDLNKRLILLKYISKNFSIGKIKTSIVFYHDNYAIQTLTARRTLSNEDSEKYCLEYVNQDSGAIVLVKWRGQNEITVYDASFCINYNATSNELISFSENLPDQPNSQMILKELQDFKDLLAGNLKDDEELSKSVRAH